VENFGLARAAAAGLVVLECEQPHRKARRGKGKSDPIDAHLAVLSALRLDAERLPTPRADGDREALRILLGARHDLTVTSTAQTNRLRAILRDAHDDTDRQLARTAVTDAPPKARPSARSNAASSDTSPASSTAPSPPPWPHPPPTTRWPLDTSRSVNQYEAAA
jgi:Transposase